MQLVMDLNVHPSITLSTVSSVEVFGRPVYSNHLYGRTGTPDASRPERMCSITCVKEISLTEAFSDPDFPPNSVILHGTYWDVRPREQYYI